MDVMSIVTFASWYTIIPIVCMRLYTFFKIEAFDQFMVLEVINVFNSASFLRIGIVCRICSV